MFQLANAVVNLMARITEHCKEPFVSEEIGEAFACALNFCLDSLVSQKGLKIKVSNPKQYNFNPETLLEDILKMYSHMAGLERFKELTVGDSRSYSDATFEKALKILNNPKKKVGLDEERLQVFERLVKELKEMSLERQNEDTLYDDAPDEFLDPLMGTLMKNPVVLPSSKTVIDYITIKKHLMNDQHDPFNRDALKLEDVIPEEDLKKRIEEYKESKRAKMS